MFLKLPYEFRGTLETKTGKRLPVCITMSGIFHEWGKPSPFLLLTFPPRGWFHMPMPGVQEHHAIKIACNLVQTALEQRESRLLDDAGNVVDFREMASPFNDDNPDTRVYLKQEDFDALYGLTEKKPGKHYWGGFRRAFRRAMKEEAKHGPCCNVDGWCVWEV